MQKLKVLISDNQDKIKIPTGIRMLIRRCCSAVLKEEEFYDDAEISVSFVDNNQIQKLNQQFRNKNIPTDVLSFPQAEDKKFPKNERGGYVLGDIVISIEKAYEQANSFGHTLNREIAFLSVHSMFHILGYDHETGPLEALQMREKEEKVLRLIGLAREHTILLEKKND
jgi:probable rRNA maturation factor